MTLYLNGTTGISGVDGSAGTPAVQGTDTNTGISFPAADTVAVNTGGSERVRCDSSGRVGIGSTPSYKLDVDGTMRSGSSGSPGSIILTTSGATEAGWMSVGPFNWHGGSDFAIGAGTSKALLLGSNNAERARIDTSGRLLVGTSASNDANAYLQTYRSSGNSFILNRVDSLSNDEACRTENNVGGSRVGNIGLYKHSGITNPAGYIALTQQNGTNAFYWTDDSGNFRVSSSAANIGTTGGTVVGTQTSDERIKNILGPVEYGLDTIRRIEPVRFALKSEPDAEKLGFIAQQVQPLIPQSVFDTKEHIEGEPEDAPTKLGMEYVALIPVLVNAIKELSAEVDALKAQLL